MKATPQSGVAFLQACVMLFSDVVSEERDMDFRTKPLTDEEKAPAYRWAAITTILLALALIAALALV